MLQLQQTTKSALVVFVLTACLVATCPVSIAPNKIEAETGNLLDAATTSCAHASGGEVASLNGSASVELENVPVNLPGTHMIEIGYYLPNGGNLTILINNDESTAVPVTTTPACGMASASVVNVKVRLWQWKNTIKLSGNVDIDFIEIPGTTIRQTPRTYQGENALSSGATNGTCAPNCTCCGGSYAALGSTGKAEFIVAATVDSRGINLLTISYWLVIATDITIKVTKHGSATSTVQIITFPPTGNTCGNGGTPQPYNVIVDLAEGSNNSIEISGDKLDVDFITLVKQHPKKGLISGGMAANPSIADHFTDYVSWYYRYTPLESHGGGVVDWATENDIEFSPMISNTWYDEKGRQCQFKKILNGSQLRCDVDEFMRVVGLNDRKRMYYLQGFNEGWNPDQAAGKYTTDEQVYLWSTYIGPTARNLSLKLVSPNFKYGDKGIDYMADWLVKCCVSATCDVDQIDVMGVHEYKCNDNFWMKRYKESAKNPIWEILAKRLKQNDTTQCKTNAEWDSYTGSREWWVTEMNCNRGNDDPDGEQTCQRLTRQTGDTDWDRGMLQWLDRLPKITRYSWWTTTGPYQKRTRLYDIDNNFLNPPGLAYQRPYSVTNCQVPPTSAPTRGPIAAR